jgi:PAS domain S-box-containing protein
MSTPDKEILKLQTYDLFMQASIGFGLLRGSNHVMEFANNAFLKLTGRGEDAIGKPVSEIFPEVDTQGYLKLLDRVISHKETINLNESPAVFLKNEIRESYFLNITFQPYFEANNVTGVLAVLTDVTAQVLARKKVEESEERLRLAIEATKLGTWEYLPLTGQLTWSEECKKIYEFPLGKEVDYALFSEHIYPEDAAFAQDAIEKSMDSNGSGTYDIEYRILRYTDKSVRWIRAQGKVFFNNDKQAVKFIGTVLDITESKLKEEQIRLNEERLRLAVEAGSLGTYELDVAKNNLIYSPRLSEIFGIDPSENASHFDLKNAIHPEDAHIRNKAHETAKKTGYLFYEVRVLWPDNSIHWIRLNGNVIFNNNREPLRIYGTALDITKQKETEKILKESQQKFEQIADAVPHMVWEINLDGTVSYINRQWADWSELSLEEINKNGWSKITHPDDVESVAKGWLTAFENKMIYVGECRFKNPGGDYSWFTLKTVPVTNDKGEIRLWIGTATNTHEKKIMDQQKDAFITIASHELKTPVTTIKAYGQIVEAMLEKNGDTKILGMIKKMGVQVDKLTMLIGDLLDLSKIQQGKLMYNEDFFDFNKMVLEVIDDMQNTSGTEVIKSDFDTTAKIYGDKNKLGQVINNLISNAIKYSPEADCIFISTRLKNHSIELSVKDFGIGIPVEEQQHVFEKFYRVNGSSRSTFPGMGIGLYICHEIITSHKGNIWVESIVDKGSSFHISLPFDHRENI